MIRYCDDLIIFHPDREYLKVVLQKIGLELEKYKLEINRKKSFISNVKNGFVFCGHYIKVDDKKTVIHKCKDSRLKVRRNIRKKEKLYRKGKITYRQYFHSVNSYVKVV